MYTCGLKGRSSRNSPTPSTAFGPAMKARAAAAAGTAAPAIASSPTPLMARQQSRICFVDSTGKRFSRAFRVYTRLISRARHQITLAMAYFIPTGAVLRSLLRARRRKVAVRVILPDKSDVPWAQRAAMYLYRSLLRRGFRIYQRRSRMLHSKVMIVDDLYSVVGSANLDPRSLHTNLEFLAVIRSQNFARHLSRIARDEIAHSTRITASHCRPNRWQLLLNNLAWWFRWAL